MGRIGERYIFKDLEFWPVTGLIYTMDYRDKTPEDERFVVTTRPEFAARAYSLNEEIRRGLFGFGDERKEMQDLIIDMCDCIKKARNQGDPFDPIQARQVAEQNKKIIMAMNYNPQAHRSRYASLAGTSYKPDMPPMPQAPPDAPIAGKDSAPDSM